MKVDVLAGVNLPVKTVLELPVKVDVRAPARASKAVRVHVKRHAKTAKTCPARHARIVRLGRADVPQVAKCQTKARPGKVPSPSYPSRGIA